MGVSEAVRAELDKIYAAKLARCRWAAHVPLVIAQRNRVEDLILTVLERLND
jgi:hypothetical protein